MRGTFAQSVFNGNIDKWNVLNLKKIYSIFVHSNSTNIPYWAKIENFDERIQAVEFYQKSLKEKKLFQEIIEIKNTPIINNKEKIIKI